MFVPILLKPKLWAVKNRMSLRRRKQSDFTRDALMLTFAVGVSVAIFMGTKQALQKINVDLHLAYFPASLTLGLTLVFMLGMLLFSNSVAALGSLLLGRDLDLILSSPISRGRFFYGKFVETFLSSSWMAIVFGAPVVAAYGVHYKADAAYWLFATLAAFPFFVIPSAFAIILVLFFTVFVPAGRTKELLIVTMALGLIGLYLALKILFPPDTSMQDLTDVLRIVALLSIPNKPWTPSYWYAQCLGELLEPTGRSFLPYLALLYTSAITLVALAYLMTGILHFAAYSRAKNNRQGLRLNSKQAHWRMLMLTPFLDPQYRAIMAKEFKLFARDMAQAVQLVLLLGLCMIYLYNFKVLQSVGGLPGNVKVWWQGFLVISNLAMGAFVTTAVCTRFVFPSLSLEGQSLWILQTAPLPLGTVLRAKFWSWLIPVACISSVVFTTGAFAIRAEPHIIFLNALTSWIICYGIVGIAVGLGAFFARFDWEHSSQLAASFGSLIYMLISVIFIFFNMLPTTLLIFLRTMHSSGQQFSLTQWYFAVGSSAALLMYMNYAATRWALQIGENALREQLE